LPSGSRKLASTHFWSYGFSSPAVANVDGVIDWSRSGNCPEACNCLAYASRSVLGATIFFTVTPGTFFSAPAIEVFQNDAVRLGVSKVR
jgi:hypothetical protein